MKGIKLHRPPKKKTERKMTAMYHRFLLAIAAAGQSGLTDHELSRGLGASPDTARGRRVELVSFGFVQQTDLRRPTPLGKLATVWQVTPEGVAKAKTLIRRQNDAV